MDEIAKYVGVAVERCKAAESLVEEYSQVTAGEIRAEMQPVIDELTARIEDMHIREEEQRAGNMQSLSLSPTRTHNLSLRHTRTHNLSLSLTHTHLSV